MGGRMVTICDFYMGGVINLRTAKKVAETALKFYDQNPSLKIDLKSIENTQDRNSCKKIWQK